jgi:hypothetical protein
MIADLNQVVAERKLAFIEAFLGTLVSPNETFKKLAAESRHDTNQLPAAFAIVVIISALDAFRLAGSGKMVLAMLSCEVTGAVMLWVLSALVIGLTALCFGTASGNVRAVFVTMAWSLLPWIFLGPLACYGKFLGVLRSLLMCLPLFWILVLQIIAIKNSFEMKPWQALLLVFIVPFLLSWYQILQFFQSLAATLGPWMA